MSSFSERREQMMTFHPGDEIITDRKYNAIMGGTILWGIIINIILCYRCGDTVMMMNPLSFYIAYFILVIAGTLMMARSDSPVVCFIGYNMVVVPVGLAISCLVTLYGGPGSTVVTMTFLYTAIITGCMIALSVIYPDFFGRLGGILFSALMGLVICRIINIFFGYDYFMYSCISAALFSLYIAYDYWRAQTYVKTVYNAIDGAASIYLDIVNLFSSLLRIMGRKK